MHDEEMQELAYLEETFGQTAEQSYDSDAAAYGEIA